MLDLKLRYKWEPFLKYGQMIELKNKQMVYLQGETGKGFYYLSKGGVKITLLSDNGDERIINYVPTGMLFGEHGVQKEPYLTSAVTISPSVIYHFSDETFAHICKEHPEAAVIYSDSLIYKFRVVAEIISLIDSPVEIQMAYFVLKLIRENGNVSFDQTSFAKYLGTSRITVNKIIQKWKTEGIVEVNSRQIKVTNLERLQQIRESTIMDS